MVSDASVQASESRPKTLVLTAANKCILILKQWPNLENTLRKKKKASYVSLLSLYI